jgi:hypothetical protein
MDDNSNKLEGKLVESLEAKELGRLTTNYAELGLDGILDDGIIKDIPILRTAVSLAKIGLNIRDRIYAKKIIGFIAQIADTTQEQRDRFVREHCGNVKRFEEAVFLILEQADRFEKPQLIGKVFKACILKNIEYQDALTLSSIVNKALWQDLEDMFHRNFTDEMKMRLYNCGLLNLGLMRRQHIDETKKPTETKEMIDGFGYLENKYFKMLMEIVEL